MELIKHIRSAWGWSGIEPSEIVGENEFGNLMVRDTAGLLLADMPRRYLLQSRGPAVASSLDANYPAIRSSSSDWYMSTR